METLNQIDLTIENYERAVAKVDQQMIAYDFLTLGKNNPYYYTGEMHNKCVDYLLRKVKKFNTKQFINSAVEFYVNNDNGFIKKLDDAFIEKLYILSDSLLLEIEEKNEITVDVLNNLKVNSNIKTELFWLLDTLLNFNVLKDSFIDKIESLNQWEQRIINSKYEQDTVVPLLISSAVARHSLYYWYDNFELNTFSKTDRKKQCLKAVFTVVADVIGATGGAVAGFTVGGPIGAGVGGVIMGGAMSGAANAIFR